MAGLQYFTKLWIQNWIKEHSKVKSEYDLVDAPNLMQPTCLEDQSCEFRLSVLHTDLWVATYFKVEAETAGLPHTWEQSAYCRKPS